MQSLFRRERYAEELRPILRRWWWLGVGRYREAALAGRRGSVDNRIGDFSRVSNE